MHTVYIYITGTSGYSRKRGDISLPFNVSFPREAIANAGVDHFFHFLAPSKAISGFTLPLHVDGCYLDVQNPRQRPQRRGLPPTLW